MPLTRNKNSLSSHGTRIATRTPIIPTDLEQEVMVGIEPAEVKNFLKPVPSLKAHFLGEVSRNALSVGNGHSAVLRRISYMFVL